MGRVALTSHENPEKPDPTHGVSLGSPSGIGRSLPAKGRRASVRASQRRCGSLTRGKKALSPRSRHNRLRGQASPVRLQGSEDDFKKVSGPRLAGMSRTRRRRTSHSCGRPLNGPLLRNAPCRGPSRPLPPGMARVRPLWLGLLLAPLWALGRLAEGLRSGPIHDPGGRQFGPALARTATRRFGVFRRGRRVHLAPFRQWGGLLLRGVSEPGQRSVRPVGQFGRNAGLPAR